MGILDSIVSPIKSVIHDLEGPAEAAEHVFGEVVHFTEDLVKEFEAMIREIETLFNASGVEKLFLTPFKDAALLAVGSVEKLFELMAEVSEISTDGVKDLVMGPVDDAYDSMRRSLDSFKDEMKRMVLELEDSASELKRGLYHEFKRIESVIEVIPTELKIISRRVKEEFGVRIQRAEGDVYEFAELAEGEVKSVFGKVTRRGEATRQSFEDIERSVRRRLEAESAQVAFFEIAMVGLLLALVAGIFVVTQSLVVVKIVAAFVVLFFVVFVLVGFVRSLLY